MRQVTRYEPRARVLAVDWQETEVEAMDGRLAPLVKIEVGGMIPLGQLPQVAFCQTDTAAVEAACIALYEEITGRTLYPGQPRSGCSLKRWPT